MGEEASAGGSHSSDQKDGRGPVMQRILIHHLRSYKKIKTTTKDCQGVSMHLLKYGDGKKALYIFHTSRNIFACPRYIFSSIENFCLFKLFVCSQNNNDVNKNN